MRHAPFFAAAAVAAVAATTPVLAATTITYGSWTPESHPSGIAAQAFFQHVTKATKGDLRFEAHYDGTVVNIRTTLPGVRDGLVDAAYVTGSLFAKQVPHDNMLQAHATVVGDTLSLTGAMTEFMLLQCPECVNEKARAGVVGLGYAAEAPFFLQCRQPVGTIADLKGRSVRAVGAFALFAQSLGATPVNTAPGEVYEAMQRGSVGCAIGGGFWLKSYSLWDVARYVVDLPLGQYNNGSLMTFNRDVWQGLTPAQRKAILDGMPHLLRVSAYAHKQQHEEVRAASIAKAVTWNAPPPELAGHLDVFRRSDLERVFAEAKAAGVSDPPEMWKRFEATLAKWTGIVAGIGDDQDKYEDALRREIFARYAPVN